jgi:hypothetical protein
MKKIIKRSSTGTYHVGSSGCQHVYCNQWLGAKPALRLDVEKAGNHMFCKKCFGKKPEDERLDYYFQPNTFGGMKMEKIMQVEVKSVYGKELVYPANQIARQFALLTGQKTFSHDQLAVIESMGYTITQVSKQFKIAA